MASKFPVGKAGPHRLSCPGALADLAPGPPGCCSPQARGCRAESSIQPNSLHCRWRVAPCARQSQALWPGASPLRSSCPAHAKQCRGRLARQASRCHPQASRRRQTAEPGRWRRKNRSRRNSTRRACAQAWGTRATPAHRCPPASSCLGRWFCPVPPGEGSTSTASLHCRWPGHPPGHDLSSRSPACH